jgi:1-acyl-sn-glycerol-3-phosphate acyltransferase
MWPFSYLKPGVPTGVSQEEAIATGIVPPPAYAPPRRAPLAELLRTLRVGGGIILRYSWRLLVRRDRAFPSNHTEQGRIAIQEFALRTLSALKVHIEVEGLHHVPDTGGLIFMWKQESHLDHLLLPAVLPRPCRIIYNTSIRDTPVYGRYLEREANYWVDKTDESQWRPALARAAEDVQNGICMLVSPEGTRSWDGGLLQMKRGAFILAGASKRPIVCVTLEGAHDRMPRGAFAVRPGMVRVVFSAPIANDGALNGSALKAHVAATFTEAAKHQS